MVEALNSRIDENNTAGLKTQSGNRGTSQFVVRNCGGGCNKSSDVKPKKTTDVKTNVSEEKSKSRLVISSQRREHQPNKLWIQACWKRIKKQR